MRGDLPIPGSVRSRLLEVGQQLFSMQPYDQVEVSILTAQAGVTSGALYHHFGSKQGLYGALRDDMTLRLLDRMEAAADTAPTAEKLMTAVLAAFDGVFRIRAGRLLIDPDPRGMLDPLTKMLTEFALHSSVLEPEITAQLLCAALKAALGIGQADTNSQAKVRQALQNLAGGL
jgi:AcrR family transcriptional regulator